MSSAMHSPRPGAERRRPARGVSLIEVLVALLVLSIGVLGLAALHGRALQHAVDAEDRLRAALLAERLGSEMWLRGSVSLPASVIAVLTLEASYPYALACGPVKLTVPSTGFEPALKRV